MDLEDCNKKIHSTAEENVKLKNKIAELETQDNSINLEIENAKLNNIIDLKEKKIRKLKKENFEQKIDFQKKIREANGRSGGLQCHINKLLKEVEELKIKKKGRWL